MCNQKMLRGYPEDTSYRLNIFSKCLLNVFFFYMCGINLIFHDIIPFRPTGGGGISHVI